MGRVKPVGTLAIVALMLGFPLAGLLWIWTDGHRKIRASAEEAAALLAPAILAPAGAGAAYDRATLELRNSQKLEKYAEERAPLGALLQVGGFRAVASRAGGRGDYVVQFVEVVGEAEFAGGPAEVRMTLARKPIAPDWRLDDISLGKARGR